MSGSLLNIIAYSTGGGSLPTPRRISRTLPASLCVMVDTARPLCWRNVNLPSICQPSTSTRKGEMPCSCSRTPSLNPPQQVPFSFLTDLTQWFAPCVYGRLCVASVTNFLKFPVRPKAADMTPNVRSAAGSTHGRMRLIFCLKVPFPFWRF